jgi:plasmid maintenance system antidote protein VapI
MVALFNQVIDKELLSPPGDTLLEHIEFIGMSRVELADRMEQTPEWVDALIDGTVEITPETAQQLEHILYIPQNFWLAREKNYRDSLTQWAAHNE